VQISPAGGSVVDLARLAERLAGVGTVTARPGVILRLAVGAHELTVFPDGRAIVKGTGDAAIARALYARYVGS